MTTCTVTGLLIDPSGAILPAAAMRFVPVAAVGSTGAATMIGRDLTAVSDGAGMLTVDLQPGTYRVYVDGTRSQFQFNIGVPDQVSAALEDLIDQIPALTPGFVEQAREARDEAVDAKDLAVPAAATAVDAANNASSYDPTRRFATVPLLVAATRAAGGAGTIWQGEGIVYREALSTATDQHITTAAGVKLYSTAASALAFNPAADGVTDDTLVFRRIEASSLGPIIDLGGRSYSLVSIGASAANGVRLTKDYRNGTLIVDGRINVFDANSGFSMSAAARARLPRLTSIKPLALFAENANSIQVWTPKGGAIWTRQHLRRNSADLTYNLEECWFEQVLAFRGARETGVSYTGAWATDNGTTALNAADNTYVGGRAQQATTVGDRVDVTFTGGGDLYVIFSGRTSGNYVNVLLDGAQTYLTLPDDGSGNRFFDTYSAADLSHKRVVQIASGVPEGSHAVRLTMSASRNPSSSGTRFIFNALSWSGDNTGPWSPEADAPLWATGQTIVVNQRRKSGTRYYRATTAGTTGATAPTHTSGTVSDGGVSWAVVTSSSYELIEHRIQAAGSQTEYAYSAMPNGATIFEDVGGKLHGNETQTSVTWYLSGSAVTLPMQSWLIGREIEVRENITATHSQIGGGVTPINLTTLRRRFTRDGVEISHEHVMQSAGQFGFFYSAMWPLLHYSSIGQKFGVLEVWSPGDGSRFAADFYDQDNPIIGRTKDTLIVLTGNCLQPDGAGGVFTTVPAPYRFTCWMDVSPESVDYWRRAGSLFMGKAMSTSPRNPLVDPNQSVTVKVYAERHAAITPTAYAAGERIVCRAFYGIAVEGR